MTAVDTTARRGRADAPPPGRRAARLARERRRRLRRRLGLGVLGLAVAVAAAAATVLLASRLDQPATAPRGGAGEAATSEQQTLLLIRHEGDGGPASTVTLLASGPADARDVVVFLPVGTLLDIPGIGLDRLGLAHQYGGAPLVRATVENALGVQIDHVAEATGAGLAAWLDRIGGLEVEVPSRLVRRRRDGSADIRFEAGREQLDGGRLAELWAFRERGEEELGAMSRQQRVLEALFSATLDDATRAQLLEGGAPQLDTEAEEQWLGGLLAALGAASQDERLRFSVLPVEAFGGDGSAGDATYRLSEADTRELVDAHLAGSIPVGGGDVTRVQVLNGVGVPGVGQAVDERLDRGAFRIVLSDNARSFDFETTQIIVYDESERALAAARRVQDLLGVGTIQVSRQPQSVIDLTIVVGADFDQEG